MKKIKLRESQLLPIYEAYQNSFSFEALSKICSLHNLKGDNDVRYEYCVKHLGEPFANGSSRAVFMLSDNWVLKLAINSEHAYEGAGQAQNKREYEIYKNTDSSIIPRILYCDRNFNYIVCENVVPARKIDFEKLLGIPFQSYWNQNSDENENTIGFNKYFDNIKDSYEEYKGITVYDILCYIESNFALDEPYYDAEIEDIIDNSEWFTALSDFVELTGTSDFVNIENFGMVNRNGKPMLVLLDFGLDVDVWDEYY